MGKHREQISYRRSYTVAAVPRSLMFIGVFWFAGCAAGSCLSYGHSCWGAHGKRSGHNYPGNGPDDDDRPSLSGPQSNNDGQPLQDRWILSRLVTRQLTVPDGTDKFQRNWYDSNRGRNGHGRNWDSNDVAVVSANNAKPLRRDELEIEDDDDEEDEIREEAVVLPRVMSRETREKILEPRDMSDVESDELVLVPPTDNHLKPIGQSHKLRLFKILNGAAAKLN